MTRSLPLGLAVLAMGCTGSRDGTWVGNPELTTSYSSSGTQIARGGVLEASEAHFLGCEEGDEPLGEVHVQFKGGTAIEPLQVPPGSFCGIFFVVQELTVQFDDGGPELTSVTAFDFDLTVPSEFELATGEALLLQLADPAWLDSLAEFATIGAENVVDSGSPFQDAFVGGLQDDSTVGDAPPTPVDELEGRLDLDDYPTSPSLYPTVETNCGASVNFDMAFPIPPATMATIGVEGVGWCESNLDFSADLATLTAVQTDYANASTYTVPYNGWGEGCGTFQCGEVLDAAGTAIGRPCTVLAFCDGAGGTATATGFSW